MSFRLKNVISTFFLLVFLFPPITEIVHSFRHSNDFHCTELFAIHFHETEHHCAICDYVPATSDKPNIQRFTSFPPYQTHELLAFYQTISFEQHNFNFSLRGPPTVSWFSSCQFLVILRNGYYIVYNSISQTTSLLNKIGWRKKFSWWLY